MLRGDSARRRLYRDAPPYPGRALPDGTLVSSSSGYCTPALPTRHATKGQAAETNEVLENLVKTID
jgi:hypothetical protein